MSDVEPTIDLYLRRLDTIAGPSAKLENEFVTLALAYGLGNGIDRSTWLVVGVPYAALVKAKILC